MNIFKKPGRILLMIMIVLAVVCPYRVHMYKTKIEEIQSGKLQIDDMPYAASDLHPYSAYLMSVPYIIIEVVLGSLYYVRTRDSQDSVICREIKKDEQLYVSNQIRECGFII